MSHPVDVQVGRNLRRIRLAKGLSQTDLAIELDMSFQQIQKFEIGSNRLSASRLHELAQIFDVPVSAFFEGIVTGIDADIVRTVAAIEDARIRTRIVDFIKSLAEDEQA
jgi:transcriptional regulator with XRE-family HTH domain